jgi:hypothetical protein
MIAIVGNIGQFDKSIKQWSSYIERFEYFVLAKDIDADNIVPPLCLLQSDRTGNKTYGDVVEILKGHFSQEPLVNAERFRFHRRHQEEGESGPMFAAAVKNLSEH